MKVQDEGGISLKGSIRMLQESLISDPALEQQPTIQIVLNDDSQNHILGSNRIINGKYKIYTFIPLVLYSQFQHFFNLYFLGLTITQFIPPLKVGFMINYIGPLSLVIFLSMCKEAYDDYQRHKRDRQINNQIYQHLTKDGMMDKKSGNLNVGMIVQVNQNERIPADLLIIKTDDKDGHVFIRTDQLDGETDWKLRKATKQTQKIEDIQQFAELQGTLSVEAPNINLYQFNGVLEIDHKESLSIENVVWANTVLATGQIYGISVVYSHQGIVVYSGKDSKMVKNQKRPQTKKGIFDKEVDYLSMLSFLIMVILAGIITLFSSPPLNFGYITQSYMRYLILVSNIIPISMRVNLEFAKLIYSIRINRDKSIEGTITRNSNIPEALGRIQYLLSDKTGKNQYIYYSKGTLTQNEMTFKKLMMGNKSYHYDQIEQMKELLQNEQQLKLSINQKSSNSQLKDFILCLALCHNVTPIDDEFGIRTYQASSPDEVALVKFADQLGFSITQRTEKSIFLDTPFISDEEYQILNCFPFSSETKRMGIIIKQKNQIKFYVKGADMVIRDFVDENIRIYIDEECENLARDGLRTLVMCEKNLTEQEYEKWNRKFIDANHMIVNRQEAVRKVIEELEVDMDFLGITGVEDRLQDDVAHTIENLRYAGINVWMLTGDKLETAICIAILAGLKNAQQHFLIMQEIVDEIQMNFFLESFEANHSSVLVIDGITLTLILDKFEQIFMEAAMKCPSVVCCRCSPTQKSQITELLQKYSKKVVATIGDGGNDVGMIQAGDVGIGIEGKEGKQAALASDFSILKFNSLNTLLLWHGRLSYKRSALLSQFIIHRGFLIATVQTIFMFFFSFLSISLFSPLLILGYSTLFTMFPVFCIIYDEDVKKHIALQFPPLYKTLQQGRFLNTKTFFIWLWKAMFQGLIIMVTGFLLIQNAFLKVETTVFTCLIFTQYAMTLTELESLHIVMIIANVLSVILYIVVLLMFPSQLITTQLDFAFFGWVFLILILSWVPLYVARRILKEVDPSDSEKLMKNVKREMINY